MLPCHEHVSVGLCGNAKLHLAQFLVRESPGEGGKQPELAGVDWIFNAWGGELGGLYKSWDNDQKVGEGLLLPLRSRVCVSHVQG